ncbi:hypothetical protein ABZY14_38040, partial [Streptomyces sp. NPDC006617]|uniref:hypothetical protein n=1 Tax=Streptomyces sp. NPDC006617 TaxID=3155354 RepID=UPI0033AF0063
SGAMAQRSTPSRVVSTGMDCISVASLAVEDARPIQTSLVLTSKELEALYGENATTYADE